MKTKKFLYVVIALAALLLSACNANFITEIKGDGSGAYIQEIGMPTEELSTLGMDAESFCNEMATEMPPGMSARQETRKNDESWCIFETQFASLDELIELYSTTDTQINQIVIADDELIYDITLDMTGESSNIPGMSIDANWIVKMPGKIVESNATEQDGTTLTWKPEMGKENNIRAVSKIDGASFDLGGWDSIFYALGGCTLLCLCCFVPLVVIGGVAFFLLRRKKTDPEQNPVVVP